MALLGHTRRTKWALAYPSILLSPRLLRVVRRKVVTECIGYTKSDKVCTSIITSKCYAERNGRGQQSAQKLQEQ